jgi:hypothetical protein
VGRYSVRFSAHDKNLGSQNYSENYNEFVVFDPWLKISGLVSTISLLRGPLLGAFLSTRQNLGSQNYSENYSEFDNVIYAPWSWEPGRYVDSEGRFP